MNEPSAEVDIKARRATAAGAKAEETALVNKAARLRREEIRRRDEALRSAEQNVSEAQREIEQLRAALDKEQRARELAERDAGTANERLREQRVELARLRDENQALRAESEAAKVKLAGIEGEKRAEQARIDAEKREQDRRTAEASLKQNLGKFGSVKQAPNGFQLILPESIWAGARTTKLITAAAAKLEPLAALLASNPDYQILIESFTDNKGDEVSLQQLTQERARVLSDRFQAAGVEPSRIQATGMGASNPLAPNNTVGGRAKNRRIEITLMPMASRNTVSNQ
jgi:outer membrane protein OmpA-like peptidoglycan-associated protein